ncbi:MAG: hypothetical protein JWO94_272, partial [Verrucomicrobiaceae bacterium]|nr:hypothetical protein [Verrucomicrobiaceae bacterium]
MAFPPCTIISSKTLGVVILTCVLLAAWFIPDQNELVHRLDQDGSAARLNVITTERLTSQQSALMQGTDREKLHAWLLLDDAQVRDDAALLADRRNMCATTSSPVELGEELFAHLEGLSPKVVDVLADALANRALALENPAEAGRL